MKKVIASILSLALLSGLSVNPSFADEIQPAEVTQEKASNVQLNQPGLTAQEKAAEKLKSDLKKYNEKQQKLIQKYENMTDKEFRWDKIKRFLIKASVAIAIVYVFSTTFLYAACKGLDEGEDCWRENINYKRGYANGENDGVKRSNESNTKCNNILPNTRELVKKILATLHPDSFKKRGKTFTDVKKLYDNANDFYKKHFDKAKKFWFM